MTKRAWWLAVIAVASVVAYIAVTQNQQPSEPLAKEYSAEELFPDSPEMRVLVRDESLEAYEHVKAIVFQSLKAPSTAAFPNKETAMAHVEKSADYYTVESYVDAENSFGGKVRTDFRFWLRRTGEDPEDWTILDSRIRTRK